MIPKMESRERRSPRVLRTKTPSTNELRKKCKVSPKGKRKLDFPLKGPLTGKSFYLDLKGDRHSSQLKKAILELGGAIEEFFHKDVKYLVTNRKDVDNGKSPASSHSAPSPGMPSPFLMTRSSSVKGTAVPSPTCMSTDSPQSVEPRQTRVSHHTRGQAICQRVSGGPKRGTTDVLSNANTWGVTVFHIDQVLKWISQLMPKTRQRHSGKQQAASPSTKRAIQGKVPKVVTLRDAYLKVEDLSFKYRPLVHEFKVWPEITFDSSVTCPFDRPRRRSSETNVVKRKSRTEPQSINKPSVQERPKHGYCECCEIRYTDLNAHLKSGQHQNFARTDSNYVSLDKAINEGPTIHDFLNELRRKKTKGCPSTVDDKYCPSVCDEKMDEVNDDVFLVSSPKHKSLPNVTSNSKPVKVEEFNPVTCTENMNEKGKNERIRENNNLQNCYTSINEKSTPVCESSIDDRAKEGKPSRSITRSLASPKEEPIDVMDKQRTLSEASCHRRDNSNKTLIMSQNGNNDEECAVPLRDRRSKTGYDKGILKTPVRLAAKDRSPSSASQHLSKNLNKVNEQPGESCNPSPFVLNEDTRIGKSRSNKRKRNVDALKRPDGLELSPILPCDPRVGGSFSYPYGDEADFLPSGLPVYSSLGSSFGDRIENRFNLESNKYTGACANHSDLTSTPVGAKFSRRKASVTLSPGSVSDVVQHVNEKSEKPVLKVALAQLDSDIIARHNSIRSCNGNDFPLIKRKRSLEDDLEHSKARKCKRIVEESGSVSGAERNSKQSGFTLEDVFDVDFRSSVAERVKLLRALSESLQEYTGTSASEDSKSCQPSPTVKMTRKKSRIVISSSPFVEITNKCIKQRQRAMSDERLGKLSVTGRRSSLKKSMEYRSERQSVSACLTPNDPFSFTE